MADGAAYKPFGPLSGFDLGNGIDVRKTFDQDYRLTALTADGVMDLSYIHYMNGMIREITDNLDPARRQYFTYDDLGRLKTANGVYGRMAWTYDNVGNRLTESRNGITESYTYKTGTNIIESVDGALDKTFTHDDDGNIHTALIQKTSASPSVTADYLYTSDGLRLRKTAGGTVVLYHYDLAGNLIGESGIGGENFKAYVYFAGTRVATVAADGSVCYYHNNHLETPVSMTDGSGNVVWKADYKPFGKAEVASSSTVDNNFRFPGQIYDRETGYHYNWNRYYDPETGRYLTADPIGLRGGINLYRYGLNNPVDNVDLSGLSTLTDLVGLIPFIGTGLNIFTDPSGSNINDYRIPSVDCDDPTSVGRCKESVALQAASFAEQYHRLLLGHDIIDVTAAGASALVGAIPVAVGLLIDAGVDTSVSIVKTFTKIYATGRKASLLCEKKCCKSN